MTVVDRDDSKPEPAERRRLGRALRHRNFRLFIGGQSISLIGTWMQQLGMSWLAYDLTRSAWLLALVNFAGQIPTLFLTPAAGVFADRWNRHRGLMVTQTAAMIQATTLVLLVWLGHLEVWHIVALSLVAGAINAFDMPLRQSFLVEMVPDRADLANAVAINSSIVNGARLVGPFIAGLLIAAGGAISCFLFNAISYVAVLFALGAMRDLQPRRHSTPSPVLRGLIEGLQYAGGFAPIRALLLMPALVSLVGTSLNMLMPVFADEILGGGPRLLGFLTGAAGIGALGAALVLLTRRSVVGLGGWIAPATTAFGASLIGLAFSRMVPLSLLLLVVAGFSMMFQMATSNTLLQTIVDEAAAGAAGCAGPRSRTRARPSL